MSHSIIPRSLLYRTVDLKTRQIQRCHGECLMPSSSQQTHRSLPRVVNGRRTCPVVNVNKVFEDMVKWYSPAQKENTLYDLLIDGRANAAETFA